MTRPRRATVLVNPAARGVRKGFDGGRVVRYLEKQGVGAELAIPASAAEATAHARASAERRDDVLLVIGGDGSVRDAAQGLAGSATALAAVPGGTVNVWAREAGIPKGMRAAIDAHLGGQSVHMDIGRAGEQCFLLMAGIGWDAEIARRVSKPLKRATGDVAYMLQAAWMLPRLRPTPAAWEAAGETAEEELAWMVLGNTRLYGGRIQLTPGALVDDGELDLIAFAPRTILEAARITGRLAAGRASADGRVFETRAAEVVVSTPGLPVQLDGDYAGETPMRFSVERGGLLVSVPAGELPPIFGRPHTDRRTG